MSTFKQWIVQLRYPYAAGVIGVVWIGTAVFGMIAKDIDLNVLVALAAFATAIVAYVGFSPSR